MDGRSLLLVAHPGHELVVHDWMGRARPLVLVLTDGSGGTAESRLEATREVVVGAGGRVGPLFGVASDRVFYRAILDRDVAFFASLVDQVVDIMVAENIERIVCDAIEHSNPVHDLCGVIAALSAARAAGRLGRPIERWEFPIELIAQWEPPAGPHVIAALDAAAVQRKLAAVALSPVLDFELQRFGGPQAEAFTHERLAEIPAGRVLLPTPAREPLYELFGRMRVGQGTYSELITHDGHVAPLAAALAAAPAGVGAASPHRADGV